MLALGAMIRTLVQRAAVTVTVAAEGGNQKGVGDTNRSVVRHTCVGDDFFFKGVSPSREVPV